MKCLLRPETGVITLSTAPDTVLRVVSGKVKSPAIVRGGMSSTQKPGTSDKPDKPERKVDPWSISGYIAAGMAVYGGLGWLIDRWAGTHDVFTPIGVLFGLAAEQVQFAGNRLHRVDLELDVFGQIDAEVRRAAFNVVAIDVAREALRLHLLLDA